MSPILFSNLCIYAEDEHVIKAGNKRGVDNIVEGFSRASGYVYGNGIRGQSPLTPTANTHSVAVQELVCRQVFVALYRAYKQDVHSSTVN